MSFEEVAQRSTTGCGTCKKRKKKCDEARPICRRCIDGDFQCLGYQDSPSPRGSWGNTMAIPQLLALQHSTSMRTGPEVAKSGFQELPRREAVSSRKRAKRYLSTVPQPVVIHDVYSFVVSQQIELGTRLVFRPARLSIPVAVVHEAGESEMKLWTMFIGAKIIQAFLDGRHENCTTLVERFHARIRASLAANKSSVTLEELALNLSCLEDLVTYMSMIANSQAAYRLLEQTLPVFVQLTARYPHLWSPNRTISITQVLYHPPHYHICKFIFFDTMASLALARPPLAHYDTRSPMPRAPQQGREGELSATIEWVYGCSVPILILIARINAWRVGTGAERWSEDWRQLQGEILGWVFQVDHVDDSTGQVLRLAVQESWRHAMLIYLYMGMCGTNSMDARIQESVQQIANLAGIIPNGNMLENHLCMPCLIAGVAARQESHRNILRRKLAVSKNENVWWLRGADFIPVLDQLWHGPGRDGRGVTWDQYANSVQSLESS